MSYCVNCGVELSLSEKSCPLCGIKVINPADPWKEPTQLPYPPNIDGEVKHLNKKFSALLVFVTMLIPIFVSCLCNLLIDGVLSWSILVIGGVICAGVFIIPPILFKSKSPYFFLILDMMATAIYLFVVAALTNGIKWYLFLAFPITDAVFIFVFYIAYMTRNKKLSVPLKIAGVLLNVAILCIIIDCLINFYLHARITIFWSLIVAVVCILFALIFFTLHRRKALLEEIKKRLFI